MKKFITLVLLLLFLTACSAQGPNTQASFYQDLYFSKTTLTYTNLPYKDILFQVGTPLEDFFILYDAFYETPLSEQEKLNYQVFFGRLVEYVLASNVSYGAIIAYSSTELNEALSVYDIQLSLNDVVIFNQLKAMIDEMDQTKYSGSISKTLYLEKRLNLRLTRDAIEALDLLQQYYLEFHMDVTSNYFVSHNISDFFLLIEDQGMTLSDSDKLTLQTAYDIISRFFE